MTAILAIIPTNLYMRPQMKLSVHILACMIILAGCAQMEVPVQKIYPFRAEFVAQGNIQGKNMNVNGAIYLTSSNTGIIQTYLPGGMPSNTIDIQEDKLVIKDIWGREMDMIKLPVSGVSGLVVGDMSSQMYLYKQKIPGGMKVVYAWGVLRVNDASLPTEVHVSSAVALDLFFKPAGKNVTMEVNYGTDAITILFMVKQGGRWTSS
jgi:hypothetical protein